MAFYILPVRQVLLEYVLKLGKVIFFPGTTSPDDIAQSKLKDDEKDLLQRIIQNNDVFKEFKSTSFILIESDYDAKAVQSDVTILEKIFSEAGRALDYVKICECPFNRPEYFIGLAGLDGDVRYVLCVNRDYKVSFLVEGKPYYYLMQKGIGLDISLREDHDPILYDVLFNDRTDEVYYRYRQLIAEACESLKIYDESRCFVYLFSKVDGMGLCDSFHFQDNKRRILSVIANTQNEFDIRSNQLYFYSKNIRTEVVHKGRKITDFVSLEEAQKINQLLFNTIIEFSCAVIQSNVTSTNQLKTYLANGENRFQYNTPSKNELAILANNDAPKTTYIAFVEGLEVNLPSKRGDYFLLPPLSVFDFHKYYDNYVAMDLGGSVDSIFESFTISDFEYVIECLYRADMNEKMNRAIIIGLNMPNLLQDDIMSPIKRDKFVDYICNKMNVVLYYDILSQGELVNGDILPPRIGLRNQIRGIYEFVDYEEDLYVRAIPGRVYGQYSIPKTPYKCMNANRDEIYDVLFNVNNEIGRIYRDALINVCEVEYMADMTLKVSYLYDVFDSLEPRSCNGDKAIKYVFTYLAADKADYNFKKQEFEAKRTTYRNPILHSGKNIYDIEPNDNEVQNLLIYLTQIILEFCFAVTSSSITTLEELDQEYRNHQIRLGL